MMHVDVQLVAKFSVPDDLPDRNCDKCTQCCLDYDGWLRFQSGLYKVVRDPLFDLLITLCIILNTMFLAMEHHGMSESVRQALDIGNKVRATLNLHNTQHGSIMMSFICCTSQCHYFRTNSVSVRTATTQFTCTHKSAHNDPVCFSELFSDIPK